VCIKHWFQKQTGKGNRAGIGDSSGQNGQLAGNVAQTAF
jgi:hypothetical protein